MSRRGLAACGAAALALAGVGVGAGAAGAATTSVPNPRTNIPLGPLPISCDRAPRATACEDALIRALDAARTKMGLGPYPLPPGFIALKPVRQWLVLANLDRLAYRLPAIPGLARALDAVAKQGAIERRDPDPTALLRTVGGYGFFGFASNYALGQQNGLIAYYGWVYDDGYGSNNIDCTSPTSSGCWGHREDIFAFPHGGKLTMGAAVVGRSYALTITDTPSAPWPYSYSWAAARRG